MIEINPNGIRLSKLGMSKDEEADRLAWKRKFINDQIKDVLNDEEPEVETDYVPDIYSCLCDIRDSLRIIAEAIVSQVCSGGTT